MMPLQYMLSIMRDPTVDDDRRDEMAKAAAPYLHPKLAAVEHRVDPQSEQPKLINATAEYRDPDLPDFVRPNSESK
jgi:hypothetical protein